MNGITPTMEAILRALAFYKYLTVSHVIALEISKSKDKSRKYFLSMMKDGLIDRQIHIAVSENAKKKGFLSRTRQEYLWHLTIRGAKFLDSHTELCLPEIHFPKRPSKWLKNDYFHRVSTIFCHISFQKRVKENNQWADNFFAYYKQKKETKKKNFESETRLELPRGKHFTPDVICSCSSEKWNSSVFCLEVYNGNKVHYVVSQLEILFQILDSTRKIEERIKVDAIPRILVTFDNESLFEKVVGRIKNNRHFWVEGIERLMLFNLDVRVWGGFADGWSNVLGEGVELR